MNRLGNQTSPYLLQHRENPVHWWPWCDAAFEEARASSRPVLLSVGYAACHWCHVMAHESFESAETASVMNERFVNVKVDREERPDLDHLYLSALQALGQQGGWPLTMFLTPERLPFWGGTYFPPVPRHGLPGFSDLLVAVSDTYRRDPGRVASNARSLRERLDRLTVAQPGALPAPSDLDRAAHWTADRLDPNLGGFPGAPKFPNFPALEFVWRRAGRTGIPRRRIITTLERMSAGGIYDHLAGGLARYAVDDRWLIPHFEKMLYDNAGYVRLLTIVWRSTRNPVFARRVHETVRWMLDAMRVREGGFASSLDADSEGEEGRYYVWSASEIDEVLGSDGPRFRTAYGVTEKGNWEGKNILHLPDSLSPEEDAALAPLRSALLERRSHRIPPAFDDKVLADWNGLAIGAIAEAGAVFARPDWVAAARQAFVFVERELTAPDGKLLHSWRCGNAQHPAMLDDYAFLADAALCLWTADGDERWRLRAEALMHTVLARFRAEDGGLWRTADDGEELIARPRSGPDDATPSGAGVAADVMARLWHLTLDDRWQAAAGRVVRSMATAAANAPSGYPSLLGAVDTLANHVDIVIEAPDPGRDSVRAFRDAAWQAPLPMRTVRIVTRRGDLPNGHAGCTASRDDGEFPRAYACYRNTCSLAVHSAAALARMLERLPTEDTRRNETGDGPRSRGAEALDLR